MHRAEGRIAFATGVTVVTVRTPRGTPSGLTVNAFTSVSLDPPLVLICIHRNAASHDPLLETGYFAVSVLGREQETLAMVFAQGEASERFRGLETVDAPMGSPLLPGCVAWLECRVQSVHEGGDHSIVVAEVLESEILGGEPLLFFRGMLTGLDASPGS